MGQTIAQIEARLTATRAAIDAIMTGAQSYTIAGRSVTRADLPSLQEHEEYLERKLAGASDATGSGILVISDFSGSPEGSLPT